jgi:hypothetical protein
MKIFLLLTVVLAGIVFTSCTKKSDYLCECSNEFTMTSTSAKLRNTTEDEAEAFCDKLAFDGNTFYFAGCTLTEI